MLPRISPAPALNSNYQKYFRELKQSTFTGEIHTDFATRFSLANDNSIYQLIPEGVIFPKNENDIISALQLAQHEKYRHVIKFCPRGGGTSTNGQSLASGIIIDCSKYLTQIVELNLAERWVLVEPGVILDQLNDFLRPRGFCFAPEISPSNRATIGGMINTDAAGTGSLIVGRTHDHIVDLKCILANGQVIQTATSPMHQDIVDLLKPKEHLINEKFTSAPRTLNGYNLKQALINLNYLFCGSEGTLGILTACKLKLTPLPKFRKVFIVKYRSFDDALRAKVFKEKVKPFAIEAIDEKLIELVRKDLFYFYIKDFLDGENNDTRAINIVEFVAEDEATLSATSEQFIRDINTYKGKQQHAIGFYQAKNAEEIKLIWELRKRSVGLISKECDGARRPIPFIEDTAVPPEKLADYIQEFKELLNGYQLHYGMYGHVDAGCVHVRPALDMKNSNDEHLLQEISEKLVILIQKYEGVLWGEHGQGFRCEFGKRFFGEELYQVVKQIKTLFDPCNQLNPGKIAVPLGQDMELLELNTHLRGYYDKTIPDNERAEFFSAMSCNGNGACFSYANAQVMCPSYKATNNRIHSPKGRATLLRAWLHELSKNEYRINLKKRGNFFVKLGRWLNAKKDYSHAVEHAFSGCLGCKACTSQCPLNVDVPEFKSKFLALYHQRYLRHPRDYLVGYLEKWVRIQSHFAKFSNRLLRLRLARAIMGCFFKLEDIPQLSPIKIKKELDHRQYKHATLAELAQLNPKQKNNTVILLQDMFTSYYQPHILLATYDLLTKLGFLVHIANFFPNGKPLQVKGFLNQFEKWVKRNNRYLQSLSQTGVPMIGIEPSVTLTYRDEYKKILGTLDYKVELFQEWFALKMLDFKKPQIKKTKYYLLSHCTEKTMYVETDKQWQFIFAAFGLELEALVGGCCGMAGSYGHEVEHVAISKQLFNMSWRHNLSDDRIVLATGYSCRSQAARCMGRQLQHPVEILAGLV